MSWSCSCISLSSSTSAAEVGIQQFLNLIAIYFYIFLSGEGVIELSSSPPKKESTIFENHASQGSVNRDKPISRNRGGSERPFFRESPDVSPMDFCAFGLSKRALGKRYPRTLNGLWKTAQEQWSKMGRTVLRKRLLSWKIRDKSIVKNRGFQIEANGHKTTIFIGKN
ncbi:hypothetical protein TNCV_1452751 [Trichonephila clavipes]|nr:hypothetical protein TNCV_1452751 [Trichonephila clavipes]